MYKLMTLANLGFEYFISIFLPGATFWIIIVFNNHAISCFLLNNGISESFTLALGFLSLVFIAGLLIDAHRHIAFLPFQANLDGVKSEKDAKWYFFIHWIYPNPENLTYKEFLPVRVKDTVATIDGKPLELVTARLEKSHFLFSVYEFFGNMPIAIMLGLALSKVPVEIGTKSSFLLFVLMPLLGSLFMFNFWHSNRKILNSWRLSKRIKQDDFKLCEKVVHSLGAFVYFALICFVIYKIYYWLSFMISITLPSNIF